MNLCIQVDYRLKKLLYFIIVELILEQRAGAANETNCFNDDPLGTQLPLPCPQSLTKGRDHPQLDLTKSNYTIYSSKTYLAL